MLSPESTASLVNNFERHVKKTSRPITPEEEIGIESRVESLVDFTVYQYTGRRVFQDAYRQVEEDAEEATMDDIDVSGLEVDEDMSKQE